MNRDNVAVRKLELRGGRQELENFSRCLMHGGKMKVAHDPSDWGTYIFTCYPKSSLPIGRIKNLLSGRQGKFHGVEVNAWIPGSPVPVYLTSARAFDDTFRTIARRVYTTPTSKY